MGKVREYVILLYSCAGNIIKHGALPTGGLITWPYALNHLPYLK
jgi:hypothetical protein